MKVEPKTLAGFTDLLPWEASKKEKLLLIFRDVFKSFGFVPIETPHLEYLDILVGDKEEEINKQIYSFKDKGERLVGLRFDLTVPLSRYVVAHYAELSFPFKRYAIGNVFRGEKPQKGRLREFTQCDFDIIGSFSPSADAEILEIASKALTKIGIAHKIKVSSREVMNSYINTIQGEDKIEVILRALDKFDKIGEEGVKKELKKIGLSESEVKELFVLISIKDSNWRNALEQAEELAKGRSQVFTAGIKRLYDILEIAESGGAKNLSIDFSIVRGLGYYTGFVFEALAVDYPDIGSICGGGRYDNLTDRFSTGKIEKEGKIKGAVGAAFGVDRILSVLKEQESQLLDSLPSLFMVLGEEVSFTLAHSVAARARELGAAVYIYPERASFKKQFKFADKAGARFVLILGEEEVSAGFYTLKDLKTGEQKKVGSIEEVVNIYRKNL
ncbi:MAG: histidine--tRNA ligase [Candidatus Dadabacteria bacterium]|nr:MAG: histidine--tRNA ligase [Candidatus Dadabacteria bacterium]